MSLLIKLEAAGLDARGVGLWEDRTNSDRDRAETVGIVNHWDAIRGWPGDRKYLYDNRFGGLLYHIVIKADGEVRLYSQRYVWHAGRGSSQILDIARAGGPVPDDSPGPDDILGNPYFFGVAINYHPDDGPVPQAQYNALVGVNRVLMEHFGLNSGQVFRHMDWTTRKPDINTINLAQFRADLDAGGGETDMFVMKSDPDSTRKQRLVEFWSRQLVRAGQNLDPRNTKYDAAFEQALWNVAGYGVGGIGPGEADRILWAVRQAEIEDESWTVEEVTSILEGHSHPVEDHNHQIRVELV